MVRTKKGKEKKSEVNHLSESIHHIHSLLQIRVENGLMTCGKRERKRDKRLVVKTITVLKSENWNL